MAQDDKPLTVNSYGFNVPCRRFLITANVTRDQRLPVVDEFVLRLLKLCEQIPVKRLSSYFGFSGVETEIVLSDLIGRSLVVAQGDMLSLHPSAHEHFRGSVDGSPRLMEIETWVERIWFDLVARKIMTPERSRPTRNLIEIKADELARNLPASFARKAFEENFVDYLRKVRRISDPERLGLYSVSEVDAGRFGYVVVRGRDDLIIQPERKIEPHLLEVPLDEVASFRPLSDAISDAYRRLTAPTPSQAALSDFNHLTGDQTIHAAHNSKGIFDIGSWIDQQAAKGRRDWQWIVGSPYIERNIGFLSKMIDEQIGVVAAQPRDLEAVWLRPVGSRWGCTPDLSEALANVRGVLRRKFSKDVKIRSSLLVPIVARPENNMKYDRIFDEGVMVPSGHLSPALEVLLVRGVAAVVLVTVAISESACVPVGFATVDSVAVNRIEERLNLNFRNRAETLWKKAIQEDGQEVPSVDLAVQ